MTIDRAIVLVCRAEGAKQWMVVDLSPAAEPVVASESLMSTALKIAHGKAFDEPGQVTDLVQTNRTLAEFLKEPDTIVEGTRVYAAEAPADPNLWSSAGMGEDGVFSWGAGGRFVRSGMRSHYSDMSAEKARDLDGRRTIEEVQYLHGTFLVDFVDAVREHIAAEVERAAKYNEWAEAQRPAIAAAYKEQARVRAAMKQGKAATRSANAQAAQNRELDAALRRGLA